MIIKTIYANPILGIPTARCATLITSSLTVMRDLVYSGQVSNEKTAIVLRLARSWFRFGSIELLAKDGELDLLRNLLDFIIEMHFKEIPVFDANRYLQLFSTIVEQTAHLIALWQAFGFAHGVCNTDNFSILSITIDYGPFQFMDHFDPDLVPNSSDDEKRYSYKRQPDVGYYNLEKLAESLATVLPPQERAILWNILAGYTDLYQRAYTEEFRKKLGLIVGREREDGVLVESLLSMMAQQKADFTLTFRQLGATSIADLDAGHVDKKHWALKMLLVNPKFHAWVISYRQRLEKYGITEDVRQKAMDLSNPRYVLRNWMAEAAIEAAKRNDFSVVRSLARILKRPFEEQEEAEHLGYADTPPRWASDIKISCAS